MKRNECAVSQILPKWSGVDLQGLARGPRTYAQLIARIWDGEHRDVTGVLQLILLEQGGVFFEPGFGGAVIGADAGDFAPKAGRVVHLAKVHQFVEEDVVADGGWNLDEPPVEGDGAGAGTGAPTRALVANADAADGELVQRGEFDQAQGKLGGRELPEVTFDRGTEVGGAGSQESIAEADKMGFTVATGGNGREFTPEINLRADGPFARAGGFGGKAVQFALEPGEVAFGETTGLGEGAAARDGDAGGTVGSQTEHVAAGARIADESEGDGASADHEGIGRSDSRGRIENELKLHRESKKRGKGHGNENEARSVSFQCSGSKREHGKRTGGAWPG